MNSNLQAWWSIALVEQDEGGAPLGSVSEVKDPARIFSICVKAYNFDAWRSIFLVEEADRQGRHFCRGLGPPVVEFSRYPVEDGNDRSYGRFVEAIYSCVLFYRFI